MFEVPRAFGAYDDLLRRLGAKDEPSADDYVAFLLETVLPLASRRYRLTADARVSVLGSSLGGLLACYAAWVSPRVAAAACMSPSMWWDD